MPWNDCDEALLFTYSATRRKDQIECSLDRVCCCTYAGRSSDQEVFSESSRIYVSILECRFPVNNRKFAPPRTSQLIGSRIALPPRIITSKTSPKAVFLVPSLWNAIDDLRVLMAGKPQAHKPLSIELSRAARSISAIRCRLFWIRSS